MVEILKRLELIKTAITLEDEEIIELQVLKLNAISDNETIEDILQKIKEHNYSQVIVSIDKYIDAYTGLVVYESKEVQGLKLELKVLEKKLQALSEDKNEYLHNIDEFNDKYNLKLGALIREILKLREQILDKQVENAAIDEKENLEKEYEEAKFDYENFSNEYEEQLKEQPLELNEEEKIQLKKAYRKASRLCHPDIVTNELKESAEEIFIELTLAYKKNDLERVLNILHDLENGNTYLCASDKINNAKMLKIKISEIRKKIDELKEEIKTIFEDEIYQVIEEVEDLDEYISEVKENLESEKNDLQSQIKNLNLKQDSTSSEEEDIWKMLLEQEEEIEEEESSVDEYWNEKF